MSFRITQHALLADGSRGRDLSMEPDTHYPYAWQARVAAAELEAQWHGSRGFEVVDIGAMLKPGALPPVPVNVPADEFDNIVRKWGIGYCCEWFGHGYDSETTALTLEILQARNRGELQ